MKLFIPKDIFSNPIPPRLFLCQPDKTIIGELQAYDVNGDFKWNSYSEATFTINRLYTDLITGEQKINKLFDLTEGLRKILVEGFGYFVIQDPDTTLADNDIKNITMFSSEYETSQKYLESFYVNTGADESKEVTYWASQFGNDYWSNNRDDNYELAGNTFDEYARYYYKASTDNNSYAYTEIQVNDATDFANKQKDAAYAPLYVIKYPNVQFYNPQVPQLSLLHLVFEKIPGWHIGTVDIGLRKQERKFEQERIAVYDFLMNEVSDTFKCVIEWDTATNTVNFYEEAEDGITDDNTVQSRFDTDIFITKDNLANEINIKYSTDDIKTRLKVTGGDDLDIREVNLGSNYIMNLDYYHTIDWMGQSLYDKYSDYKTLLANKKEPYNTAMKNWVGAYNKWNELMNAVPASQNILLVGDEFDTLYCIYKPVYADDATDAQKETAITNAIAALTKKLDLYRVKEDTDASKSDNILLKLKNSENSNEVTFRVFYDTTNSDYRVRCSIVNASSGVTNHSSYTLRQWVTKNITKTLIGLDGYKITLIGTLGAYLCLTIDESDPANIRDYGVNLLKTRQKVYTTIFISQTEGYMSNKDASCTASDTAPTPPYVEGQKWLDTSIGGRLTLKEYNNGTWKNIEVASNTAPSNPTSGLLWLDTSTPNNYVLKKYGTNSWETQSDTSGDVVGDAQNYARYIDNFAKLRAVEDVLNDKEKEAEMYLSGYAIDMVIDPANATREAFNTAARKYFPTGAFTDINYDSDQLLYTFTHNSISYAIYLNNKTPYISYAGSQAVYQNTMNYIVQLTDMQSYFGNLWESLSPFIREDEFSDSNCALTGYESEEERLSICNELLKLADKELKTLSQPSLEFSMTMANILALSEFAPIKDKFQLGNFVRVGLPNNLVKRARLLEVNLSFDDLSDFSATFGNLITTKSEIDKHAELMAQAVNAGKQVASNASNWQKAVDQSTALDKAINEGLKDAALTVANSSGQNISWDERGILCRKKNDSGLYDNEQMMLTNNKLVYTTDNWNTSKGVFGSFTKDGKIYDGVLADALIGGYIEGSFIKGGKLEIGGDGGRFIVNENGSVEILAANNTPKYAADAVVNEIQNARQYHVELVYSNSTVFNTPNQTCQITAKVYKWDEDITSQLPASTKYSWIRNSSSDDTTWNANHANQSTNIITITNNDVNTSAQFSCQIEFDDTNL